MDLGGMPVHHGLVTMAGLGLAGVAPLGRSGRWELAISGGKGRGGLGRPHRGYKRAVWWRSRPGDGGPRWRQLRARGEGGSVHVEVEETAPIGSTGEMLGE
jgi:hypothetical protein